MNQAPGFLCTKKPSGIRPGRALVLLLVVFAYPIAAKLIENVPITLVQLAYLFLNGAILTGFLAWLVPKIHLRSWSLILLLWLDLLVVEFLNNFVEGYFFTSLYGNITTIVQSVTSALFYSAIASIAAALLLGQGVRGIATPLKEYLSSRKSGSWVLRMIIGSAAYFPIYFFFGMLISPFVLPYYNNPSLGLRIPPFTVMIPVELFRGLVYVVVLLPLLATLAGEGRTKGFIALAAMLYVPGGLIPLLGNSLIPAPIVPFHALEILADSIVYGFVLSRVLARPVAPKPSIR